MNRINEVCHLQIDNSTNYYFYISLTNVTVNEYISYFISDDITKFKISYIFLEEDNYEDLSNSEISNYNFIETLGSLDHDNFFKSILKKNDRQKGLLLKMKIINYKYSGSFKIERINLNFVKSQGISTLMNENENNYFYIDNNYLMEYEIFVFSSYNKKKIKEYWFHP